MQFLATDLLVERRDLYARSRPTLLDAFHRRLRSLRDRVVDGESKPLQGPGGFWESKLSDDFRLLWQRGTWRGDDAIFLYTIGDHDHVYDEARRIHPDGWEEVLVEDPPAEPRPWPAVPIAPQPDRLRYWRLNAQGEPWELDLTDDQELLVDEPGPLLVTGAAGSGKTTLLAHRAAREASTTAGRLLFVTFHPELADFTQGLLQRLHGGVYADRIDVLSFRELCERLWARQFEHGVPWIDPDRYRSRLNTALLAEGLAHVPKPYIDAELRGALKGRWLAGGEPPSLDVYRRGLRTDLTFLGDADRLALHRAFERLRRAMSNAQELDAMDAARVLAAEEGLETWEGLFLDEAQDFTEVELELLAHLVPDPSRWAIAADEMQVVYPSLFRWDRVRDVITRARARRKEAPVAVELHRIETNHRNPEPILALAHAVLDWRAQLCGGDPSPQSEARAPGTLIPRVTAHARGDLPYRELAAIAQRVPLTAILCPTPELAEEVRSAVRAHAPLFTRALDFASAKGLEFDVVVACHPFEGPGADAFERAAVQGVAAGVPTGVVELSINRLYVAITRSRRAFFALDEVEVHRTWRLSGIASAVESARDAAELVRLTSEEFAEARSEQWADAARSFARVGAWEQEAECWSSAGEHAQAARTWEEHDQIEAAAEAWERAGAEADAARCRAILAERDEDWSEAASFWTRAGNLERWRVASARAASAAGDPVTAARLFEEAGLREEAVEAWERAGIWEEALRVAEASGRADWRARLFERLDRDAEAARCWAEAERPLSGLDAALRTTDRTLILEMLNLVLAFKDPKKAIRDRADRLPPYARAVAGARLGDWSMRADGLFDDHNEFEAHQVLEDGVRGGSAVDVREGFRLQWRWAAKGSKRVNATEVARDALRAEIRFALDGQGDKDALERAVGWAKRRELPVDKPDDLIALARRYREVCSGKSADRDTLRKDAQTHPHPVARGIVLALGGDVSAARKLWKGEGLNLLGGLNPMRVDEHLPPLRREYIRGAALGEEARHGLRENLDVIYKVCKGKNAGIVGAMLAELDGDPGRAWSQLRDLDRDLAPVRHESPRQRRQRIERLLANGATWRPDDLAKAITIVRAYVASDSKDTFSSSALAVWTGDGLAAALGILAREHRGDISLPLTFELVELAHTQGSARTPLGETWASLAATTLEKAPVGVPYRVLLERLLGAELQPTTPTEDWISPGFDGDDPLSKELISLILPKFPTKGRMDDVERAFWRRVLATYGDVATSTGAQHVVSLYAGLLDGLIPLSRKPALWVSGGVLEQLGGLGLRELARRLGSA